MPQRIFFAEIAKSQLRRIDRVAAMRLLLGLTRLVETNEGDVKTLERIRSARDELAGR
jgi:hypothetical protein